MSPTKRPSEVPGLRRAVAVTPAAPAAEDPAASWREKRVSEMTTAEVQAIAIGQPPRAEKPDFLSGGAGHASRHCALRSRTMLAAIMRHVARFCTSDWRSRVGVPSGWIGVRPLAVQRVWG